MSSSSETASRQSAEDRRRSRHDETAWPLAVSVQTLAAWRTQGRPVQILDVREPWELEICSFPEALAVPMEDVSRALERLPRQGPLVVVCHHGVRSAQVTGFLRARGFSHAINLSGGVDAWAREIDSDMALY